MGGRWLSGWLILAMFWGGAAQAESSIMFNLKEADLETVVATVAEFTGKNFIIDPRVKGKVTVISSKPMTKEEVYQTFLSLLEVHNFAAIPVGNVIKIMPAVNAKQSGGALEGRLAVTDEIITRVLEIKHVSASQLVPILRPLVPQEGHMAAYAPTNVLIVSDRSANMKRLLAIIERIDVASASDIEVYKLNYASASEVVRILESLRQQEKRTDPSAGSQTVLVADERTNSILIGGDKSERLNVRALISHLDTPLETTEGNTHVIYLRYAKAKDLVPVLTGLGETYQKEQQGVGKAPAPPANRSEITIQAHESTNSLVITAPPDLLRSLQTVIKKLDIRRAQVLVEAVIADISVSRAAELGVQWLFDGTPGGSGPVGGINFSGSNILGVAAAIKAGTAPSVSPGVFLGLGRFDSTNVNFAGLINALESDGETNILSRPTIVTMDNEEAEIVVGQNVPFLTGSYTSTGSGSTPTNPFTTIQRENVGLTLKVKPQINEGDAVKLDIEQKVDSVAQSAVPAADLITNTRSIKTSVLVDDGGAIALGGLIREDLQETEQKVPLLGDIPLLGSLFRYRKTTKEKTNLMVVIRPVIIRDAATLASITNSKYEFVRAQQLKMKDDGVALMNDNEFPAMPSMSELLELPPPFESKQGERQKSPESE